MCDLLEKSRAEIFVNTANVQVNQQNKEKTHLI